MREVRIPVERGFGRGPKGPAYTGFEVLGYR